MRFGIVSAFDLRNFINLLQGSLDNVRYVFDSPNKAQYMRDYNLNERANNDGNFREVIVFLPIASFVLFENIDDHFFIPIVVISYQDFLTNNNNVIDEEIEVVVDPLFDMVIEARMVDMLDAEQPNLFTNILRLDKCAVLILPAEIIVNNAEQNIVQNADYNNPEVIQKLGEYLSRMRELNNTNIYRSLSRITVNNVLNMDTYNYFNDFVQNLFADFQLLSDYIIKRLQYEQFDGKHYKRQKPLVFTGGLYLNAETNELDEHENGVIKKPIEEEQINQEAIDESAEVSVNLILQNLKGAYYGDFIKNTVGIAGMLITHVFYTIPDYDDVQKTQNSKDWSHILKYMEPAFLTVMQDTDNMVIRLSNNRMNLDSILKCNNGYLKHTAAEYAACKYNVNMSSNPMRRIETRYTVAEHKLEIVTCILKLKTVLREHLDKASYNSNNSSYTKITIRPWTGVL